MSQDFPTQLRDFYGRLDPLRKGLLAGAGVLGILSIAGVGLWATQTTDALLTHAGDTDEAEAITRALAQADIPYTVDTDGRTIRVPADKVTEARRAASTDGGILGLEGLDQIDPWATPFQEQLYQQRMMQGELVRTINTITGVASSTVHLTLPERSAFLRDELRATAAVTLRPDPGTTLDRNTGHSVAELVSHAVNGMTPSDVTVVDSSSARMLWGETSPAADGSPADLGSMAASREVSLANGARSSLSRLLGDPDAATVNVHVELETSAVQQTVDAVDPDSQVAAQEKVENETDTRSSGTAGGAPGTDSNLPERASGNGTVGAGRSREASTTTYSFTKTTTTTTRPAGDIRRITASVMIDTAAITKLAAGGDEAKVRASVEEAVKASLGWSEKRGDEIVVTFVPFANLADADAVAAADATATEAAADDSKTLVIAAAAGVGLLLLLGVLFFVLKRRPAAGAVPAVATNAATHGAAIPAGANAPGSIPAQPAAANSPHPAGAEDDEDAGMDLASRLRSKLERLEPHNPQQVSDLVRKESEPAAEVLRRWIQAS